MDNKTKRPSITRWILGIFLGLIFLFIFNLARGISRFFDKTSFCRPYTYKIGNKQPEYVTYERTGFAQYKISFHKTKDNPETDYILLSTHHLRGYPPLKWGYMDVPENKVFIDYDGSGWVRLDTIVTSEYEIYPGFNLWSGNKVLTREEQDSARIADESLWCLPLKLFVHSKILNQIGYTEYTDWDKHETGEGKIVKSGK